MVSGSIRLCFVMRWYQLFTAFNLCSLVHYLIKQILIIEPTVNFSKIKHIPHSLSETNLNNVHLLGQTTTDLQKGGLFNYFWLPGLLNNNTIANERIIYASKNELKADVLP